MTARTAPAALFALALAACAQQPDAASSGATPSSSPAFTLAREGDHWVARAPSGGSPEGYRARFSPAGLRFAPARPGIESEPIALVTSGLARDGAVIDAREGLVGEPVGAVMRFARGGAVEEFEPSAEGVEQRWRFASAPAGTGDLVVRVAVSGERFERESASGLHFVDPYSGVGVRYGRATWVDAAGHRTTVATHFVSGAIVLRVPADVLASSSYPCVLDPVVSAEFGMDMPVTSGTGTANRQVNPSVAFDGTNYLAVWQDFRNSGFGDIYGARFAPNGTVLDANGIAITTASNRQAHPAVAFDGTNYLVVWEDSRGSSVDIYGSRVSPAGSVLDAAGLVITSAMGNQVAPTVASNGSNFLVAWEDARAGGADVYAARVSSAGVVLDGAPQIPVSNAVAYEQTPSAASDGTNYLLVWTDFRTDSSGDIFGARISSAGMVLDATGRAVYAGAGAQSVPALTFAAGTYFAVWQDDRANPGADQDVYAARITPTGMVSDAAGVAVASGSALQQNPSAGFNGTNFLVTWDDVVGTALPDVRSARVSPAGMLLDTTPLAISADPATSESDSAVGSGAAGYAVVVYDHVDATLRTDRIRARSAVGDAAAGQACTTAAGCASGNCVDGFCCNTACGNGDPNDCQACSVAAGGSADGVCSPLATTHVCRASAGVCDAAESCDGINGVCPADGFAPPTQVCRPSSAPCDAPETCTGTGVACPADALAPPTQVCRPSAGVCDTAESCTGSSPACPADDFLPSSTVCRPVAGVCDVAEYCTGSGAACPADGFSRGNQCRASAGDCDEAEACDGTQANCPVDAFLSGVVCRTSRGVCDATESCDGTQANCPPDGVAPAGTMCRAAGGACDVAESCDGVSVNCPGNQFAPTGTVCRPSAGACDAPETCQAFNPNCPPDQVYAPGFECRPSVGTCDVAESCDGINAQCPVDQVVAAGQTCRAAAGPCDVAEQCSGTSGECPADVLAPATQVCRPSGGVCDLAENCTGTTAECPTNAFVTAGRHCSDENFCSAGDTCDGQGHCFGTPVSCTMGGSCTRGSCCGTMPINCDDGDPCTQDSCAPGGGCDHVQLPPSECTPAPDAGAGDAAVGDAAPGDAAEGDASGDAAQNADGGSMEGGAGADGGGDEGPAPRNGGCGCSVPGSPVNTPRGISPMALALGVALIARRRRYARRF